MGEHRGTILVVDDNPSNVSLLFNTLEKNGYKVLIAHDGESALSRVVHIEPELILLDIMMPGLDGIQLCKLLKSNPKTIHIPIIFMTAVTDVDEKIRGFEAGGVDYITKPFQVEEVVARVAVHLKITKLQNELKNANQLLEQRVRERTDELSKAKDKAEEVSRLKTALLGNLSHELRTPLNGIIGVGEVLKSKIADQSLTEWIEMLLSSGSRLKDTLNSILRLSELEAGLNLEELQPMNISEAVENKERIFRRWAEVKNLDFSIQYKDTNALALLSRELFTEILYNLVNNAIKYTSEGSVTVIVDVIEQDGKMWSKIDVIDSGIGIAEDQIDLIFHEFRQGSEGVSRAFEGTGLGLTLSKKMANMMNGEILLESEVGKGSTFTLLFPIADKEAIRQLRNKDFGDIEQEDLKEEINDSEKPNILYVEDNIINVNVTREFLKRICNFEHALNVEAAIKKVNGKQYDAILMDINLGSGANGLDAVKIIKEIPEYKETPIAAVTGFAYAKEREKLLEEGCTHYLPKPFSKAQAIMLIKDMLEME